MPRTISFLAVLLASAASFAPLAEAQVDCNQGLPAIDRDADSSLSPVDFVRNVTANEIAFAKAFGGFGYTLEVGLATLAGDTVDGEFRQVTRIAYENGGAARRVADVGDTLNTLKRVTVPRRDVDALRDAFTVTPDILADRDVVYSGRQRVGDVNAAVFDILPRNEQTVGRAFVGRLWVRARESAIVRICGRVPSGPFGPMRYLVQRTKIVDQYWFPVSIAADETVRDAGNDVHVRVGVKYSDYTAR